MKDEIKDANLELLIGLKEHLEHAARLRTLLDRLLRLARPPDDDADATRKVAKSAKTSTKRD
jgi:hypothetical protein